MRRGHSKYHAKRVRAEGQQYASVKEYKRYLQLRDMEQRGVISELRQQVKYELLPKQTEPPRGRKRDGSLIPGRTIERAVSYIADFVYLDADGVEVVEDCKGYRTKEYTIKRKLMLWRHGIRIKET